MYKSFGKRKTRNSCKTIKSYLSERAKKLDGIGVEQGDR